MDVDEEDDMAGGSQDAPGAVKSADRVIDLFELLARWGDQMSHAELAATLDIPKSSLTQLLRNLVARSYVEYIPETKKYRLGGRFVELAHAAAAPRDLVSLAEPALAAITEATGESAAVNFRSGDFTEVVATTYGRHRLLTHMRLGDKAPLHLTSSGKLFLANMPDDWVADYAERTKLEPVTKNSITSLPELKNQLRRVREDHVAYVFEEFTVGVIGIAVPVLDLAGNILAGLNVVIPTVRFDDEVEAICLASLKKQAGALQRKLSGKSTSPGSA